MAATRSRAAVAWAFSLCLALAACGKNSPQWHGSPYSSPPPAPDIVLTDTSGDTFRLSDRRGAPALLYFGYTHFPDVCPATLGDLKWIFEQLGPQADRLTVAFVTVDPARDSPEVLRAYLDLFESRFVGLTGTLEDIKAAADPYGVMIEHATHGGLDEISHTARVFLIDGNGLLQTNYSYGTPREEILEDLQAALGNAP